MSVSLGTPRSVAMSLNHCFTWRVATSRCSHTHKDSLSERGKMRPEALKELSFLIQILK